jgi:hypothetical protein
MIQINSTFSINDGIRHAVWHGNKQLLVTSNPQDAIDCVEAAILDEHLKQIKVAEKARETLIAQLTKTQEAIS